MSTFQPPGRRRLGRTIGVAVVILAVVAGILALIFSQNRSEPVTPPTGAPTSPTMTPTSDTEARAANGCLGGSAITGQMVLTAQQEASLDDIGGAEFAASVTRWGGINDQTLPPRSEVADVMAQISSDQELDAQLEGLAASVGSESDRTGPSITATGGGYYVESSTEDEIVVSVLMTVPEWSPSPDQVWAGSNTFTLERSTGTWIITDAGFTRQPDDLQTLMTPFVGGC